MSLKTSISTGIMAFIIISLIMIQNSWLTTVPLPPIDYILIEKNKRIMTVYSKLKPLKSYKVALGFSPIGHKQQEGDGKTPEGKYFINHKNRNSQYFLALQISYPSKTDRESSYKRGTATGGNIMIHGLPNGLGWLGKIHTFKDWTRGCIALSNEEIDEIYPSIKIGTPVEIKP